MIRSSSFETFDHADFREAFSAPGMDTRQWVSYGIVEPDSGDQHAVFFNDADGNPVPQGVLVLVKLQPSGTIVPCRVAMHSGGGGEGEYTPFGPGDEVLVAIPRGSERAGCVIIGRFANQFDTFPSTVSGMDVTQNNVAFKRILVPYVMETGGSWSIRQSITGASLTIDPTGSILASSGDGHTLSMNSDIVGLQLADGNAGIQLLVSGDQATMFAKSSTLVIDDKKSQFQSGGGFTFSLAGLGPQGHGVTLEQVVNLLINWTIMLAGPQGSSTLATDLQKPGALLSTTPSPFPVAFDTALSTMLLAAAAVTPPTPTSPGGGLTLFAQTYISPATGIPGALLLPPIPLGASLGFPGIGNANFQF